MDKISASTKIHFTNRHIDCEKLPRK